MINTLAYIIVYIMKWVECHPTALATFILALVTLYFIYTTKKENQKYRQFKLILKKIDEFYSPLSAFLFETENKLKYIKSIKNKVDFNGAFLLYLQPQKFLNQQTTLDEQIEPFLWAISTLPASLTEDKILNEITNFNKIKEIMLIKIHLAETEVIGNKIGIDEYENNLNFLLMRNFIDKFYELYNKNPNLETNSNRKNVYDLISKAKWDNWGNFYRSLQNDYNKFKKILK